MILQEGSYDVETLHKLDIPSDMTPYLPYTPLTEAPYRKLTSFVGPILGQ